MNLRQIPQPTTNYSPVAHTGEQQQQHPSPLLKPLGTACLWLGLAILAFFVILVLLTRSVGNPELIFILFVSGTPIGLGLFLRYLSREANKRDRIGPSVKDPEEVSEHPGSLFPGASPAMPVSSVTEGTTELLDAKREGRFGGK